MGVIPNPKMTITFPISCILAIIFPIVIKYFPKCEGKGSFLKSQIKSLVRHTIFSSNNFFFFFGKKYDFMHFERHFVFQNA